MDLLLQYAADTQLIILLLLFFLIILFIWNLTLSLKLGGLKKRFNRFTRGTQINNLEQVILQYTNEMEDMKKANKESTDQIHVILNKLTSLKGMVGIIRYNAFGEQGNDQSYSIAIIDENKNGIVISSIYNRGQSNTYAKPIEAGKSTYQLSKEELDAIEKAVQG